MKKRKKDFGECKNKKGISPVIATVLLIAMVVAIGLIVFMWFRGMVIEEGTKFEKNIKLNCPDVNFDASYSDGKISILNIGNIPIYKMKLKIFKEGSYETEDLSNWPELGLNEGGAFTETIEIEGANKIILIPVLIGSSGEGKKTYTCEDQYGYEISI
jgi:flagellin-like protein